MDDAAAPALEIIFSLRAKKDLDEVWDYNASFYSSAQHANEYVGFLRAEIETLATNPQKGMVIETNPKFRYLLMQWSTQGNGHVAVYRITRTAVRISRVFHTSQDWQNKVKPRSRQ